MMGGEGVETAACKLREMRALAAASGADRLLV